MPSNYCAYCGHYSEYNNVIITSKLDFDNSGSSDNLYKEEKEKSDGWNCFASWFGSKNERKRSAVHVKTKEVAHISEIPDESAVYKPRPTVQFQLDVTNLEDSVQTSTIKNQSSILRVG